MIKGENAGLYVGGSFVHALEAPQVEGHPVGARVVAGNTRVKGLEDPVEG